jgi:hypothetical protein
MKPLLLSAAIVALLGLPGAVYAGIGNGNGIDKGAKNGWISVDHHDHDPISVPKGLVVSGDNGRVDNGDGNGGEHPGHHTPNHGGEDAPSDQDPN